MARITHVTKAQQRFATVPVLDENGQQVIVPVTRKDGSPKRTKTGRAITRRLTQDDKSQPLPNRKCEKCRQEIKVGDPYKWVKPKSGPYGGSKRVRCAACPSWKPSELSSSKMATLYAAQEAADEAFGALMLPDTEDAVDSFVDDVKQILNDLAEGARDTAGEYQEGLDNMPDGLRDAAYETQEKIEALESFAEDLEGWDPSADSPEIPAEPTEDDYAPENPDDEADVEQAKADFQEAMDEWEGEVTDAIQEWAQGVLDEAQDAASEFSY